jgi:hypothetical protein
MLSGHKNTYLSGMGSRGIAQEVCKIGAGRKGDAMMPKVSSKGAYLPRSHADGILDVIRRGISAVRVTHGLVGMESSMR